MTDFFKKLNVLVKASINDLLGEERAIGGAREKPLNPNKLGKDVDHEINSLRQRINEALDYEDKLQAQAQTLQIEVEKWDQQADEAVTQGNDSAARYAVEQLQRAQQRSAMAESDLHEHQFVTQELIQRVNELEAAVADVRRSQVSEDSANQKPDAEASNPPVGTMLSDTLREMRETIGQMGDMIRTRDEVNAQSPQPSKEAVEDDLTQRRERLSKK